MDIFSSRRAARFSKRVSDWKTGSYDARIQAVVDPVGIIIGKSSSALSVGCVGDGRLRRVEVLTLGWWVSKCIFFSVFSVVVSFVICFVVVGVVVICVILGKSLSALLAASAVNCGSDGRFLRLKAVALGRWVPRFVVCSFFSLLVFVSIGVIVSVVMWKSSATTFAVDCGSDGRLRGV